MLNGLGKRNQNIVWITDNDQIVSNSSQLAAANTIINETINKYLVFPIGNFELKTLDADFQDKRFEKLCSVADLVAGALVDYVGDYDKENKIPKEMSIVAPIFHPKSKIFDITDWLLRDAQTSKLKKVNLLIEETSNDSLVVKALQFPYLF